MASLKRGMNEVVVNIAVDSDYGTPLCLIESGLKEMFKELPNTRVFEPQTRQITYYNKEVCQTCSNPVYERFETLKSMNTIVKYMNDEDAYLEWIEIIPDGADDFELWSVAEDDDDTFAEAVLLFRKLICTKSIADGGLYVGDKVYELRKDSELK